MLHDAPAPLPAGPARGERVAAALGAMSAALLAAALRDAHHWGVLADATVAGWAATTAGGLVTSLRVLGRPPGGGRLALAGLLLSGVSVLAFVAVGAAYLMGGDPTGPCGGG